MKGDIDDLGITYREQFYRRIANPAVHINSAKRAAAEAGRRTRPGK